MTLDQSRSASEIDRLLNRLREVAPNNWWQKFLYHFTDVQNAVSILEQGALFSRNEAARQGIMVTDNASPGIIDRTSNRWKDYARLYFHPKTQTQYRNEGFRPMSHYWEGAHCPMPVFFLFDSQIVLSRADVRFSNGNLASDDSEVFDSINEERILQIVSSRQSEVIVPDALRLDAVRFIVCRSEAERETLLRLISPTTRARWERKFEIDNGRNWNIFFRDWPYVESVELNRSSIIFHFNLASDPNHNGPFNAVASITDTRSGKIYPCRPEELTAKCKLTLDGFPPLDDYSVKFSLDDHIAYAGRYQAQDQDDLPMVARVCGKMVSTPRPPHKTPLAPNPRTYAPKIDQKSLTSHLGQC